MQKGYFATKARLRRFRWQHFLLALFITVLPAHAKAAHAYDLQHYDLLVEPRFPDGSLALTATVTIDNPRLETSFSFGLNKGYSSVQVTSPESAVTVNRAQRSIDVLLAQPSRMLTLVFKLDGDLGKSDGDDRKIIDEQSLYLLWSDQFYPIDFNDWATVTTAIILPAGFEAIAPGRRLHTESVGGGVRHTFTTSVPQVNYSIIADRRWTRTERTLKGIPMVTLLLPESQRFTDQILSSSADVLRFYSDTFGAYPFEQFGFVTVSGIYARRALSGFVAYEPAYLEKEMTTTGHDAHETALLWWGYTSHAEGPGAWQWFEGFGDYAEILYDEARHMPHPRNFEFFRSKYLALPAEKDLLYTELRGNTDQALIHGKYPWLMHLVRYVVGDRRFESGLRLVFERFRYRSLSMDEFLATLEEGAGQSLSWFRKEWLERKGVPSLALQTEIQERGNSYEITGILEQKGETYHLPVEIGIQTERGLRVERLNLNDQNVRFAFRSKQQPTKVLLDPHGWLLMNKASPTSAS